MWPVASLLTQELWPPRLWPRLHCTAQEAPSVLYHALIALYLPQLHRRVWDYALYCAQIVYCTRGPVCTMYCDCTGGPSWIILWHRRAWSYVLDCTGGGPSCPTLCTAHEALVVLYCGYIAQEGGPSCGSTSGLCLHSPPVWPIFFLLLDIC